MATSSIIKLSLSKLPGYSVPGLTQRAADMASKLLQKNHDEHHVFFNHDGFHDHIVHHILTLFALGASPEILSRHYYRNASYQRPKMPVDKSIVTRMHDPQNFKKHLGDEKHYSNYVAFFKEEIDAKGWKNVLNEYLFARDARADDLLVRTFSGLLHPLIHLGFAIEFEQPALVAESLSQAAVHDGWMRAIYLPAEEAAKKNTADRKPLTQILDLMAHDRAVAQAARYTDANKIRDGLLARAPEQSLRYLAEYRSSEATLEADVAEMMNLCAYFSACAQDPTRTKKVKFDFFHIHCLNCSVFFTTLMKQEWLKPEDKVRLLEWKSRTDLAIFASRGCPKLDLEEVKRYASSTNGQDWSDIENRVCVVNDDGHSAKMIRALAHGAKVCGDFEGPGSIAEKQDWKLRGDLWLKAGNMAIDSVENTEMRWVRSAGFTEAWEDIPQRATL